jgi:hypothetical protein
MSDIRQEKYAKWLEETLRELVDLKPEHIGIVTINADGSTGTAYFDVRNSERWLMVETIIQDNLLDFMRVNADVINDILGGLDSEDGE